MATAATPYRTDSMDYMPGFQIGAGGNDGLTCWQMPLFGYDLPAFLQYSWPSSPVDSAIDTSAAHEAGVSGVDNGFGGLLGNVPLDYGKLCLSNHNFFALLFHCLHLSLMLDLSQNVCLLLYQLDTIFAKTPPLGRRHLLGFGFPLRLGFLFLPPGRYRDENQYFALLSGV